MTHSDPAKTMSLIEHLSELRTRLLWCFTFLVGAFACLYPFADHLFAYLTAPLAKLLDAESGRRMIYTGLPEAFLTYVKVTLFTAFTVTFPVLAAQIWRFVMPGLYQTERRVFRTLIVATPCLFLLGAAFAFYGIIPLAWQFFLSYETSSGTGLPIQLEARISEYLSMTLQMMIAFGLCFQLPLILYVLGRFGLVKAATLAQGRRYAGVAILIVSAFLTPPDVLSMMGLALPLYGLYELGIILVRIVEKKSVPTSGD
jgi:sec-independent protein translocase protein TatC